MLRLLAASLFPSSVRLDPCTHDREPPGLPSVLRWFGAAIAFITPTNRDGSRAPSAFDVSWDLVQQLWRRHRPVAITRVVVTKIYGAATAKDGVQNRRSEAQ